MIHMLRAACGCHTGKVRKNNEDNFCFAGRCLEAENDGLPQPLQQIVPFGVGFHAAIFDGMGGENFGELASYAAAKQMVASRRSLSQLTLSQAAYLHGLTNEFNDAVLAAQTQMRTSHMGTTMVSLSFWGRNAYICNVGDSRAYRLRNGEFTQLSVDHVIHRPGSDTKKAPLTQYLGFGSGEYAIEPSITTDIAMAEDVYLLCSDGLSDMLTDSEISDILTLCANPATCVQALMDAALERGGRDNITVIVCKLT